MPTFVPESRGYEVSRHAVILDTNVLYAAFSPDEEGRYEFARALLDESDFQLLIPVVVLVEAWGLLVGRGKRWDRGLNLLDWIADPGHDAEVVYHGESITALHGLIAEARVDCVDAILAYLAHRLSNHCDLRPPIRIATFDTGDFVRCRASRQLDLTILDMKSLDEY